MRVTTLIQSILPNICVGVTCAAPLPLTVFQTFGGIKIMGDHVYCYWQGKKCEDNDFIKRWADKANRFVPGSVQGPMMDKVLYWGLSSVFTASMGAISLCLAKHSMSQFSNVCGSIKQFRSIPKAT